MGYDGVTKAFAIQAGRELRVLVESDKIKDGDVENLAFQISEKIQDEMTYPGSSENHCNSRNKGTGSSSIEG